MRVLLVVAGVMFAASAGFAGWTVGHAGVREHVHLEVVEEPFEFVGFLSGLSYPGPNSTVGACSVLAQVQDASQTSVFSFFIMDGESRAVAEMAMDDRVLVRVTLVEGDACTPVARVTTVGGV